MSDWDELPWGDSPYDSKTPAEVIHDYVMVRGDLSEQYARDQLAGWIERYAKRPSDRVRPARPPHPDTMAGR